MTPDAWQTLQKAFEEAVELKGDPLQDFLAVFAKKEPALAAELTRMLEQDDTGDDALLDPVAAAASELGDSLKDPWIGKSFGNYKVTRKIATGGMSAVYLGKRTDQQFDQTVAIKIVANHFTSEDLVTRFRTERQILAKLQHPNIAQLFDGGTTDDGLPYLIMEYIDGLPLDEYCDRNVLDIDARLQLFSKVCAAVEYAHRNLIVHRDIKPSNIIVTDDGEPKLLDFGIAKPLEHASLSQTIAVTRADLRAMTPEYASPEQVRGEAITTATDVYSLGVLLYRLLCGRMPYLLKASNVAAVAQAICETVPSRPSTVIATDDEAEDRAPRIVALRGTTVARLQKTLAGDLDTIVLATLQKEPDRRYASARALGDDIDRYRNNLPVMARPDSLAYRGKKFVARHRAGVAASSAGVLVIVALVAFYTWQVTEERNRAELEATKAQQVVDFLSGVFRSSSPYYAQGDDLSVREVLQRGTERIDEELADQPEILAELLLRLGVIHQDLGLYDAASPLMQRSLEIRQSHYGADDPNVVPAMINIGGAFSEAGRNDEAMEISQRALAIASTAGPEFATATATLHRSIGNLYYEAGDDASSVEHHVRALEIYASLGPERNDEHSLALHDIASPYREMGDIETSLSYANRAYAMQLDTFGRNHPSVAISLNTLSVLNQMQGNPVLAEQQIREAAEIRAALFGNEHPEYAIGIANLGRFLSASHRWDETEALYAEALAIFQVTLGPNHRHTISAVTGLGEVYSETGRPELALEATRRSLDSSIATQGARAWDTAIAYAEYGDALLEANQDSEAVSAFRESVSIFAELRGGMATAYTRAKFGRALLAAGMTGEAATEIALAQTAGREIAADGEMFGRIQVAAAELALAQERNEDAQRAASEAEDILSRDPDNRGVWYWRARTVSAALLYADGRTEDAEETLQAAIGALARDNGTQSRAEVTARRLLESFAAQAPVP